MTEWVRPDRPLRLYLLGGFRAEISGHPIPVSAWLRRGSARTIVKLLAVRLDHRMHREEILEILWPEIELERSLNSFRKALHAARHALEPGLPRHVTSSYLRLADGVLTLDMAHTWIDVNYFEALAVRALNKTDPSAFEAALAVYGGELLPEDMYEDWTMARRQALSDLHVRTLQSYATVLERGGDRSRAEAVLRQILVFDPVHEEAHRTLMRLYAERGDRPHALREYQELRVQLERELDTVPDSQTEELHGAIVEGAVPLRPKGADGPVLPDASRPRIDKRTSSPSTFVGRDRVLDTLRDDLSACQAGALHMALIAGAAGVGKSRLAREVARDARQLGYRVLQGSCYSRESIQPYGPFVEALETYLATHPSWRTDLAVRYPHFGQLIPSLAGAGVQPAEQISPDFVHASLLSSFASVLAELAESHPLLLVLDDLHEADRASLELLQHLVHTAESHRWFIMGTYRDDEIPPGSAVQRTLSAATRAGLSRRITLRGLSSNDTRRLVVDLLGGGAVDTTLCHRIYSLTLGNPLFVQELVSSLRENGMLERVSGCWRAAIFWPQPMPHHIRALVSARVMRLGETAVQVLHLAAVAGMEWSPSDLRTAAQIAFPTWFDEELLLQILDRALDASILEDRGETYAFKHPMIRRALLDETPSHRAARFHAAVGAAIERHRPHDLDDLAFHFGKSHDDEKAIRYLRDAAVHAQALHTDDVAERHLRDLLERYERLGRTWDAADAREQLGIVLDSAEQYEEALEELSLSEDAFRSLEDLESARRVSCRMKRLRSRQPTAESVCPDAPLIIEMARVP